MPKKPAGKPAKGKNVSLRKSDKSPKGGLTESGRKRINKQTGSNLKAPVTGNVKAGSKDAKRRKSFCARSKGIAEKYPSAAKNPKSRLSLARKRWKC